MKPYECADVADEGYPDGLTANLAVKKLNELTAKNEPFCLAVGFSSLIYLSHLLKILGYVWWSLHPHFTYARHSGRMRSGQPAWKRGAQKLSIRRRNAFHKNRVSDEYARKLRHAYFACVSYMDAQVGKVLDALEASGKWITRLLFMGRSWMALRRSACLGKTYTTWNFSEQRTRNKSSPV